MVFAVSWRGPSRPDLQQLLGDRFATLTSTTQPDMRHARRRLNVDHADFVIHSEGRPGAFWGMAYLPQATPSGVTAKDLQ